MNALYLAHPGGLPDHVVDQVRAIPDLDLTVDPWDAREGDALTDRIRDFDVLMLSRQPNEISDSLAEDPGRLKWICYLHGGIKTKIGRPIIRSPIQVTNWGDHPGVELAEGALVLLLCCLKDVHYRIMEVKRNRSRDDRHRSVGGTLQGLRVGVYGCGFAGKAFVNLLRPLGAGISIYDPYAGEIPDGCVRVDSLEDLFDGIHALVIHAARTPETEKSVTAELLAKLPDQGIVVNTARGAILDQEALFAELKSGRLRAGLDVLDPDHLPDDHEARGWENLIYGAHCFCQSNPWPGENPLTRRDEVVLENLRNFVEGRPLNFVIDETRYNLMT